MSVSREVLRAAHELLEIGEAERDHRLVDLAARLVAHSVELAKVEAAAELLREEVDRLRECALERLRR